ncbi:hypothetical protein JCM10213_002128 [Rhodosporidiobolus nylandii]
MSTGKMSWTKRQTGVIGVGQTLSLEQQQLIAAVPRWKKEWVRPSSLKPSQNPNFKILKWVPDKSQDGSAGTDEEMQAAAQAVVNGSVPVPAAAPDPNATISLFPGAPAASATAAAPQPIPSAALAASQNPLAQVQQPEMSKPPAEQAPTIGGQAGSVQEAVKPLEGVPMEGVIGTGGQVSQQERSLVE